MLSEDSILSGMSESNKNVVHGLFSMQEQDYAEWKQWLQKDADISYPRSHLKELNDPRGLVSSGRREIVSGVLFAIAGVVASLVLSADWSLSVLVVCLVLGGVGAGLGLYRWFDGRSRRLRAYEDMCLLESKDGFLWRFEQLLTDWDDELSKEVQETLRSTCLSSKDRTRVDANNHSQLRAYWFWIVQLNGRMDVIDELSVAKDE